MSKNEFKAGDWVVFNGLVYEIEKTEKREKEQYIHTKYFFTNSKDVKLWQPQINECCVFWNKEKKYICRKLKNIGMVEGQTYYIDERNNMWKNIAPLEFINMHLKEMR